MSGRFSKPVFPGEALTISVWEQGDGTGAFRTSTPSGVVLDSGQVRYR
jgi:acyl dehydratase